MLFGENVFYPYQPATSRPLRASLNSATAAAAKEHFPLKVALIGSRIDLGIIPQLFGKPQAYARYLDLKISFKRPRPLLVVMRNGYGVAGLPAAATAAASKLSKPTVGTPNGLAAAALSAVTKLSAAPVAPFTDRISPLLVCPIPATVAPVGTVSGQRWGADGRGAGIGHSGTVS